jgi:hypothetical protein
VSKELDLTLTSRDHSKDKDWTKRSRCAACRSTPVESYIARLVAKGYKVAICEQMEDPALAKGLVKRDIIRVVTPGTVTESSMLVESKNNYFACVFDDRRGLRPGLLRRLDRLFLRDARPPKRPPSTSSAVFPRRGLLAPARARAPLCEVLRTV